MSLMGSIFRAIFTALIQFIQSKFQRKKYDERIDDAKRERDIAEGRDREASRRRDDAIRDAEEARNRTDDAKHERDKQKDTASDARDRLKDFIREDR